MRAKTLTQPSPQKVSTAARLADGALLVVDVVEGVCTQTRQVSL